MVLVITNAINLMELCHKTFIWWWSKKMAIGSNIGSQPNSHTAHSLSISEQSWSHLQFSHQNIKNIFIYERL